MREGQRDTGAFQGLERNEMSSLRLAKTLKEIVCLRLLNRQCYRGSFLHRQTEFMRDVRHWPATFALTPFKIEIAQQATNALFKGLSARDLDPIGGSRGNCGIDEIV